MGVEALHRNTTGNQNTAMGDRALASNTTGFDNAATGFIQAQARAWAGALTLIAIVLILTVVARFFSRRVRTVNP